eukprot:4293589-Pyramimonas_sp.AAC.1
MALLPRNIFRRAWKLAFSSEPYVGDEPSGEEESFSRQMSRKVRRVSAFLDDAELVSYVLTLSLTCKPLDDLIVELIRRDENGSVLPDLLSSSTLSPVRSCQQAFVNALCCGDVHLLVR